MNFLTSEKAVSEVMGFAIILGITITGISIITLVGVPSIYKLQDLTTVKAAEQTFTLFNSKASSTMLGDAPMRVNKINLGGGTVIIEPNSTDSKSYMIIKNINNTFNVTIPMGMVKYIYGERIVGYEGGGVWSKYPSGGSVMISPPEMNYDGRTLMLPVLTINGNATVGGKGTATVVFKKNSTVVLFPNTTADPNRTNPLNYSTTGIVYVSIISDFYDAWVEYAKSLSFTNATPDPANRTANIEFLVVPSTLGGSTPITNPVAFRGVSSDNDPLDEFRFKISVDPPKNNLKWDIRAKSGTKTLIFYLKDDGSWGRGNTVTLRIGYLDSSVDSRNGETWEGESKYTIQDDNFIYVDLLDKNIDLTYQNVGVGANDATRCQTTADEFSGIRNPADSWDNLYITTSDVNKTQSLYNVTQHYFSKMAHEGDAFFYQCNSGDNTPGSNSTSLVDYDAAGTITFLYASNNIADVSII